MYNKQFSRDLQDLILDFRKHVIKNVQKYTESDFDFNNFYKWLIKTNELRSQIRPGDYLKM